jgi:hypothetical protein
MSEVITFEMCNGLRESTEEDLQIAKECFDAQIPLSAYWARTDNDAKYITWDSEWEKYCKHRAELIDFEGRDKFLPWKLHEENKGTWDSWGYLQKTGDCCSFGNLSSLHASQLTICKTTGRTPVGINPSYTYAFARGNGRMSFDSGLNLSPMMKYAAKIGNYRIQDVGKYDCSVRNYNSQYDAGALQNQTIAVILPKVDFDLIFLACSAGFGVHTGASRYPSSSSVNSDGLAVASGFSSGGHATAYVAAYTSKSGKRYIYFMNSHGAKYAADELSGGQKQHGCWVDNQLYRSHAITSSYGAPYVNLPEIPK